MVVLQVILLIMLLLLWHITQQLVGSSRILGVLHGVRMDMAG